MLKDWIFNSPYVEECVEQVSPDELNDKEDEDQTDTARHRGYDCCLCVVYRTNRNLERMNSFEFTIAVTSVNNI